MQTIQVVIDEDLLRAVDRVAQQRKSNRSALMREALREHLRRLALREREEADRRGYAGKTEEDNPWEAVASWPDE